MENYEIINTAIENLNRNPAIKARWDDIAIKDLDGKIHIQMAENATQLNFEVKQELRQHQVAQLEKMNELHGPFMIVARHIFPKIKEELREKDIAYLEANGNIYLNHNGILIWLDGQKPIQATKEKGNRAFTKTGLKVLFHFLLDEHLVQLRYREMAQITRVGLGNINYIMNGLKEMNFLIEVRKQEFRLNNKKELLEKWMVAYEERLKPALLLGTFRFVKENDFLNWKNLEIDALKTKWGGEPAGDLYTNYLRPQVLTLYTTETRNDLIRHYKLIPDEKGNVKVYRKFWHLDDGDNKTVPPLLIYADLMNTGDRRCMETAEKIYDGFLRDKI